MNWSFLQRSQHGAPFLDRVLVDIGGRHTPTWLAGSGEPLLLLHGYPLDQRLWGPVISILAKNYLCIVPNLRGFGDVAEESRSFSLADLADDCEQLLRRLSIQQSIHLCGLSMGGYIAMEMTERYPDRIRKLILTNTKATSDEPAARANRISVAQRVLRDGVEQTVAPMLNKLLCPATFEAQPDVVEIARNMLVQTRGSTIAWAQLAMANRRDFSDRVREWKLPIQCIVGSHDELTPPSVMQPMNNAIGQRDLITLSDSGHLSPLEQPEPFCESVRKFLQHRE